MEECKMCVIDSDKVCDECINYNQCKETVDFVNPPDEYPECWKCAWLQDEICPNES